MGALRTDTALAAGRIFSGRTRPRLSQIGRVRLAVLLRGHSGQIRHPHGTGPDPQRRDLPVQLSRCGRRQHPARHRPQHSPAYQTRNRRQISRRSDLIRPRNRNHRRVGKLPRRIRKRSALQSLFRRRAGPGAALGGRHRRRRRETVRQNRTSSVRCAGHGTAENRSIAAQRVQRPQIPRRADSGPRLRESKGRGARDVEQTPKLDSDRHGIGNREENLLHGAVPQFSDGPRPHRRQPPYRLRHAAHGRPLLHMGHVADKISADDAPQRELRGAEHQLLHRTLRTHRGMSADLHEFAGMGSQTGRRRRGQRHRGRMAQRCRGSGLDAGIPHRPIPRAQHPVTRIPQTGMAARNRIADELQRRARIRLQRLLRLAHGGRHGRP